MEYIYAIDFTDYCINVLWNQCTSQFKMHLRIISGIILSLFATAYGFMGRIFCWFIKTEPEHHLKGT